MLNSGLCEKAHCGLEQALSARVEDLARRAHRPRGEGGGAGEPARTARDFATLLYSSLVRQMQRTVKWTEEDGPVAQGARDFFGMFLPRCLASQTTDPLTRYVSEQISSQRGDRVDEEG